MSTFVQNLRFAARTLRKNPTFTWVTVVLVGLGVGAVTTVFTVVDQVLLRPLPYPGEERLVYMTNGSHNGPTLRGLDEISAFDSWAPASTGDVNLTVDGSRPLRLRWSEVTPTFFQMFGGRPLLGRLLTEADYDDLGVVVLTYPIWMTVWGGNPDIVGSTIVLDGSSVTVVGVLSEDFVLPERVVGRRTQMFHPMDWNEPGLQTPGQHMHSVVARLAPGVDIAAADQQLDQLAQAVADQYPDYYADEPGGRPDWPLVSLRETTVEDAAAGLWLLLGAVGLLLLVACANVAHLFMARGLARVREMAIRRSLGADTRLLLGQLVVESLLVGVVGGLLGIVIAWGSLAGFSRWTSLLPRGGDISLDLQVLAFAIALATLTALLFGLLPALRTIGRDVGGAMRDAGRGATGGKAVHALRSGLVVAEVGGSLVMVVLAGLFLRSFLAVTTQHAGVQPENVWVLQLNPAGVQTPEEYRQRMDRLLDAVEAVPTVRYASYGLEMPFEHVGGDQCCWTTSTTDPESGESLRTVIHAVTADFFKTLGTELVAGSDWTAAQATGEPAPVVMSEPMAIRAFGSAQAAVGRSWEFRSNEVRVVGVAEYTFHYGLDQVHEDALYVPMELLPFPITRATVALKTTTADAGLADAVREAVWSVEPTLPVPTFNSLEAWISESSGPRRFGSLLSSAFGALALLLAAGGLYGTLLYAVGQRRRELGIRLALGAGQRRIKTEVVTRGVLLALAGVALGAFGAWFGGRLLESWLYGVSGQDPVTFAGAALVLLATAALASWLPAHRAGKVDPLETLRAE